jgi:hypothetical protein
MRPAQCDNLSALSVEGIRCATGAPETFCEYVRRHDYLNTRFWADPDRDVKHAVNDFERGSFGNKVSSIRIHASPPSKTTTEREYSAFTKVNSSLPGMAL